MGHYASEMGFRTVKVSCDQCGASGEVSEILGSLHATESQCIRYLRERIERLEAATKPRRYRPRALEGEK